MKKLLGFVLLTCVEAVLHIGVFDVYGTDNTTRSHILAASLLAVKDFNGASSKATVSFVRAENNVLSIIDTVDQLDTVDAIVGPHLTQMTEWVHDLAVSLQKPAIFYGSSHTQFSEGRYYSDFVRISPSDVMQGHALADIISNHYKWRYMVLLTSPSMYWQTVTYGFTTSPSAADLHIHIDMPLADGIEHLASHIRQVKKYKHRIFLLLLDPIDAAVVLGEAARQGLLKPGTQLLGPAALSSADMLQALVEEEVEEDVMRGYIGLQLGVELSDSIGQTFIENWRSQPPTMTDLNNSIWCNNATDASGQYIYRRASALSGCLGLNYSSFATDGSDISMLALLAYDATYIILRSLEYLQNATWDITRRSVFDYITTNEFAGVSGRIGFDQSAVSTQFGLGDRAVGVYYKVVNYQEGEFYEIGAWRSETGYLVCNDDACYHPVYNTNRNAPPSDLRQQDVMSVPSTRRILLLVLSSVGMLCGLVYAWIIYTHRRTLLIKISQPALVGLNIVGCTVGCLRALTAAFTLNDAICAADLWLGNLSFAIVVSALLMKTWRVHRVMNSGLKRIKISTNEVLFRTLGVTMIIALELMVWFILEPPSMTLVVVNMHENQVQRKCESRETTAGTIMAGVVSFSQILLLSLGVWYTYLTRHIPSGINDSFKIGQVILSLVVICVAGLSIVYTLDLEPHDRQFIIAILYLIAVYRCLYLLFADRVYYLFLGYELDSNFMLSKRAPSSKSLFAAVTRQLSRQASRVPGAAVVLGRKRLPSTDDSVSISTKRLQLGAGDRKAYTPQELEEQMILCKAKIAKYQCRLMEIQEIAVNQNYVFNYAVSENSNEEEEDEKNDVEEAPTKREKRIPEAIMENDAEILGSEMSSVSKVPSVELHTKRAGTKSPEMTSEHISDANDEVESFRTMPARALSVKSNSIHPETERV